MAPLRLERYGCGMVIVWGVNIEAIEGFHNNALQAPELGAVQERLLFSH
jgi:hypothetical protein